MMRLLMTLALILAAGLAVAKAPERSLRPVARPGAPPEAGTPDRTQTAAVSARRPVARPAMRPAQTPRPEVKRPQVRPAAPAIVERDERGHKTLQQAEPAGQTAQAAAPRSQPRTGLFRSLRPLLRPRVVSRKAVARRKARARGAVCDDMAIQGTAIGGVHGKQKGCGVIKAVKVREISGIGLSQQAVMDCVTAKALKRWIDTGMKPAVGNRGGGVARIRVIAHYACRTRNNQPGAKISEHGRGRAIDIAGFTLRDGSRITVLTDWNKRGKGRVLHGMHKAACGPFGTVLGPEANRYHRDHFHFDTARYRSGSYCR